MLVFVCTAAHDYTLRDFLALTPSALRDRVVVLAYDEFLSWARLPAGHYVLADVDRLDPQERPAVAMRLQALQAALPDAQVLNHPLRSLGRAALLEVLYREGPNTHRACPASGNLDGLRFPVFIRASVDHTGTLSDLLTTPSELNQALARLRHQGTDLDACLVVEFVDVRNAEGLYEKYSALRVGPTLFATDLSVNDHWICKGEDDEHTPVHWLARDLEFQRLNPHADLLWPVFERAGIEYGRIDYAFCGQRLHVFEINTNPMIQAPSAARADYRPSLERHADNFVAAMLPLTRWSGPAGMVAVAGARGPERVAGGSRLRRGLRRLLRATGHLAQEHRILGLRERLRRRV